MDPLMMDPLMSDPLMSSLDIGPIQRAAIKRRLSDNIKATHSTKLKLGPRTVSLSPTEEDVSLYVCLHYRKRVVCIFIVYMYIIIYVRGLYYN